MKSPFPGMDPYIEATGMWEDFHSTLITHIKEAISASVPKRYAVRAGKRSYVVLAEEDGKGTHEFVPDVKLTTPQASRSSTATVTVSEPAVQVEPVEMEAFISEEFREAFIDVYDSDEDQRLVASIEVLSPSNKRKGSLGWQRFLRKRQSLMLAEVCVVEIDLLRGGTRMTMRSDWPKSPYTLLVHRRSRPGRCRVWPAHFQTPLPVIPVSLLEPDPPVLLALQPLIDITYERGRYREAIDYSKPLQPPLSDAEAAWLAARLKSEGEA